MRAELAQKQGMAGISDEQMAQLKRDAAVKAKEEVRRQPWLYTCRGGHILAHSLCAGGPPNEHAHAQTRTHAHTQAHTCLQQTHAHMRTHTHARTQHSHMHAHARTSTRTYAPHALPRRRA